MEDSTRRRFLTVAGTGAVAGVALVATSQGASAATPAAAEVEGLPAQAEPALTAYVRDSKKGEVLIMSAGHEVVVTDHKLVARLAHAFAAANKA